MRLYVTLSTLTLLLLGSILPQIAAAAPSAKIIGGDDATAVDVPWMSGLHYYDPGEDAYAILPFCGASLIAPGWVVTAAHCVNNDVTADTLLVRVNRPDLGPIDSPPIPAEYQPQHLVQALTVHPSYTHFLDGFDLALLHLETASSATPVSIADDTLMAQLNIYGNTANAVDILGWGVYDSDADNSDFDPDDAANGPRPRLLQQATLDFVPLPYPGDIPPDVVLARKFFAPLGAPNGVDSCFGDSGGPLFVPADRTIGTLTRDSSQLVGVTSFGNVQCNSANEPGGYTRIASYTDWIETVTFGAGDPLSDLRIQVASDYHDIAPDSDTDFSVTVFNDSHNNEVSNFSFSLQTDSNNTRLIKGADITGLACSPAGLATINCTSSAVLLAGSDVTYQFTVHDSIGTPRADSVTATITAQSHDDYRLANNSDVFAFHYTEGPDVGVSIDNIISLYGKFDIVVRNESDFFSANNVSVTFTSDIPLNWVDTSECIASSDVSVTCTTTELAPLTELRRTITLPANVSMSLFYGIEVSVTHDDSPDNNSANDSADKNILVRPTNERPASFVPSSSSGGGGSAGWLTGLMAALLLASLRAFRASARL